MSPDTLRQCFPMIDIGFYGTNIIYYSVPPLNSNIRRVEYCLTIMALAVPWPRSTAGSTQVLYDTLASLCTFRAVPRPRKLGQLYRETQEYMSIDKRHHTTTTSSRCPHQRKSSKPERRRITHGSLERLMIQYLTRLSNF
ncbi:hypothetical protein PAXRUDRAFT_231533 [Paxillus rubicundulus Ve08.2h10]|uniref:Unplaced genomic scaffold scaffold_1175, whole genome shotgun sequence n=1 Tax=Paxillus rubicundulus Ve08.2h10 TaxID=930991 RepID=A0A0D0CCP2_9AGAM|nr:hypothetical protein PAXRUDRAFT_231533 [Paxillus rubicundulus Ve08.2h10]